MHTTQQALGPGLVVLFIRWLQQRGSGFTEVCVRARYGPACTVDLE